MSGRRLVVSGAALAVACGTAQAPAPAPSDGLRRYQAGPRPPEGERPGGRAVRRRRRGSSGDRPRLSGARHDQHRRRSRRLEPRLDQRGADHLVGDPCPHQPVRRRGPLLARARGGTVRGLLRERRRPSTWSTGRRRRSSTPSPSSSWPPAPAAPSSAGRPRSPTTPASPSTSRSTAPSGCSTKASVRATFRADVPEGVGLVAFESENRLTNTGQEPWEKETGLLSIWILGMFPPSDGATVVIPFTPGPEEDLGPVVNDAYFGKVPPTGWSSSPSVSSSGPTASTGARSASRRVGPARWSAATTRSAGC